MCFNNNSNCNNNQEPAQSSAEYTAVVPATVEAINATPTAHYNDNTQLYNDTEILSTFDPYYMPSSSDSNKSNSTNKLHQLLTTVNEQWTNVNSNDYTTTTAPVPATASSSDNYGTDQYPTASSSGCIEVQFYLSISLIHFFLSGFTFFGF